MQLDEQLDERLVDRLQRGHAKDAPPSATLDRETHGVQHRARLYARGSKRLLPSDARGQAFFFAGPQRDDFDFGVKGLSERGKNMEPAQARCMRGERRCER
ncbi:MAG TPA: hypothetical protein VIG70_17830 [Burkholderiales bacterium]